MENFVSILILGIEQSPAIMLKEMQDSILGCWSSHGEGTHNLLEKLIVCKFKVNLHTESLMC
jgi:hypothetical protein